MTASSSSKRDRFSEVAKTAPKARRVKTIGEIKAEIEAKRKSS